MKYMQVEVTLAVGDEFVVLLEQHETLYAAEFRWTMGELSCDCERCGRLAEIGYDVGNVYPCFGGHDDDLIKLVSIRPFILH